MIGKKTLFFSSFDTVYRYKNHGKLSSMMRICLETHRKHNGSTEYQQTDLEPFQLHTRLKYFRFDFLLPNVDLAIRVRCGGPCHVALVTNGVSSPVNFVV